MSLTARWLAILIATLACTSSVFADRTLFSPKGTKLISNSFKIETVFSNSDRYSWFAIGLSPQWELEAAHFDEAGQSNASISAVYNIVLPIIDISPGISFGVVDATNETIDGRAVYAAITYRYGNYGELNQDVPTELSFGVWTRTGGAFVSTSLPFADFFRLIGEHDGRQLRAGVDIRPIEGLSLKVLFEPSRTLAGASFQARF